ncbi:MAG: hypothetical protein MZU97_09960 [Bacillus subtilis]|nr:hypothetical protein [Bacillus subtilis]
MRFAWNTSTKVELGVQLQDALQHLHGVLGGCQRRRRWPAIEAWLTANSKLEWFQQADAIEAAWLANGVDSVTKNAEGDIDNVAGVTISDGGYLALAVEAVELAKAGKFQAIKCVGSDLYIATMTVNAKGEFSELLLDVLQATKDHDGRNVRLATPETKQQKGFNYKMHYNTYVASLASMPTPRRWPVTKPWLTANNKLEWFQQAQPASRITSWKTAGMPT